MYPRIFVEYFREFDRAPEVFVAMPFSREFEQRWKSIYKPAINSLRLKPYRVNMRIVSDSILTDILQGIGRAKFVLVDISPEKAGLPNSNVMYELGLAYAMRLPEEVIVLRAGDGKEDAPFDIRQIRWNKFNPQNVKASQKLVMTLLKQAARDIELTRDLILRKTLRSLDPDMICFVNSVRDTNSFDLAWFDEDRKGLYALGKRDSSAEELRSIARTLIERGILESGEDAPNQGTGVYGGESLYVFTPLGRALLAKLPRPVPIKSRAQWIRRLTKSSRPTRDARG